MTGGKVNRLPRDEGKTQRPEAEEQISFYRGQGLPPGAMQQDRRLLETNGQA